jgi:excisionase family DNA binding protein
MKPEKRNTTTRKEASDMSPRYLDLETAANYLSMSPNTLRALVKAKRITFSRRARRIRFDIQELDKWISAGTVEAVGE